MTEQPTTLPAEGGKNELSKLLELYRQKMFYADGLLSKGFATKGEEVEHWNETTSWLEESLLSLLNSSKKTVILTKIGEFSYGFPWEINENKMIIDATPPEIWDWHQTQVRAAILGILNEIDTKLPKCGHHLKGKFNGCNACATQGYYEDVIRQIRKRYEEGI